MIQKDLTDRLSSLIKEKNWTQERLAREIHASRQTVNRWFTGKILPSANNLARISEATGCNLAWLQDGKGEMFPQTGTAGDWIEALEGVDSEDLREQEDIEAEIEEEEIQQERKRHIARLLRKASLVLEFQFHHSTKSYSDSLAANIEALYRAIKLEEKFIKPKGLVGLKRGR